MAQPISNLALGDKVWISDNGTDELYEIAGYDVHGVGTVTLVKTNVSDVEIRIDSADKNDYENSVLDFALLSYVNRYNARHRAAIKITLISYQNSDNVIKEINRPVFALSDAEVGWSGAEGSPLPLYSSNATRKKTGGAIDGGWWLRSIRFESESAEWYQHGVDGDGKSTYMRTRANLAPAFVISSSTNVSDAPADNGYAVYFPDAVAIATPIHPYGEYVSIDEAITFEWAHSAETGTLQTRADIQYRAYEATWQDLLTVTGAASTATFPAYTFNPGRFFWRVRTYNEDGAAGPWSSEAAFVCVGAPVVPVITAVTITNRPIVAWESSGQIGYQAQIGEYDTGEMGGQAKTHKIPYYIPNGTYTARVRIKGASLLWSAWAEQEFVIAVTGPAKPALTAEATAGAAVLTFAATGAEKLYLLRDGIPIANVTGLTTYTDYAALGSAVYILRAVDASDNYTDSDPVGVTVSVPCVIMAAVDALDEPVQMNMKKSDQHGASRQKDIIGTAHYYAGRTRPVYRFSGFVGEQYSPAFYYTTSTDFARLEALIDKRLTILYRDNLGNKYYGVITGITHTQENYMYEFALAIMRVDYIEQIDYEV